jgi:hypothetical protein
MQEKNYDYEKNIIFIRTKSRFFSMTVFRYLCGKYYKGVRLSIYSTRKRLMGYQNKRPDPIAI